MLIAKNDKNERILIKDASTTQKYYCPLCGSELIIKRGIKRCHHFAHKSKTKCTEWQFYDMCEWHTNWQMRFSKDNIEVVRIDDKGKKHVADVLVNNTEIEFQHSHMPYDEFFDRNSFYSKFNYHVIWVFDGNDIFKRGLNTDVFPFSKKFECLKYLKDIPEYLDIFIEGEVQPNLFTDSGLFLHHVKGIDETAGVLFDGTCTVDEFMNNVINNLPFQFKKDDSLKKENCNISNDKQTVLKIAEQYPKAKHLVLYNTITGYNVLINRYNIDRIKQGKRPYGKLKRKNNYSNFNNSSTELYYTKDPVWIFLNWY